MSTATAKELSELTLKDGRTVGVEGDPGSETLEIRAENGEVELRISLTPDGPVLQLDGVKVQINASDSIAMQCKTFSVDATENAAITSGGELDVRSEGEMKIESTDEVRVRGKMIHLN